MNEMDQLTRFRAEVPPEVSPRAEHLFQQGLYTERRPSHRQLPWHRSPGRRFASPVRIAVSAVAAVAVAIGGVVVALQPAGQQPLTVQLLADRAAAAALTGPDVSAGQWVYERLENYNPGRAARGFPNPSFQDGWMTADGTLNYGAGIVGDPIFPYDKLGSLPRDPAALIRYFRQLDPVASDDNSVVEFSQIESMLFGMILPPWLQAEMYHALALIPHVQVREHVKDIAGRAGVAFVLPPTKQSDQLEIILDASDYHLLARADQYSPSQPDTFDETAILTTVLVTELGSTQPATAPPSAAQLAAERLVWDGSNSVKPPQRYTADQWVYRDLRTSGRDRQVWATADDTVQAEYVNGTLQVCKRTDPCAASEQWLMPAGPTYGLVYPRYQRPTRKNGKLVFPPAPPSLPQYPGPLLHKLDSYGTGCADVANDCNAVNVVANMLTGYGNDPYNASGWFLALADVPGVSVQQVTDAAGQQVTEFTFPFRDGVTGILVSGGFHVPDGFRYEGYVRDGQQTLVMNQAIVSGPGVLPAH